MRLGARGTSKKTNESITRETESGIGEKEENDKEPTTTMMMGMTNTTINSNPSMLTAGSKTLAVMSYATVSSLILVVNKMTLFTFGFPSAAVVALSQMVCTVVVLLILKYGMGSVSFPEELNLKTVASVFPLTLLFLGNAVTGLQGTGALSIPMFTVLRRTNMILTMILECVLLGKSHSRAVHVAVGLMLAGSMLAAAFDLSFDATGYAIVMLNNIFTSLGGVMTKLRLGSLGGGKKMSVTGMAYLNAAISAPLLVFLLVVFDLEALEAVYNFPLWGDPAFLASFTLSSLLGIVLQLTIFYSTQATSALGTVVTGVLKNSFTTFVGVVIPSLGYTFSPMNFIGIVLSLLGGLWYVWVEVMEKGTFSANRARPGDVASATFSWLMPRPAVLVANSPDSVPHHDDTMDAESGDRLLSKASSS